MKQGKSNIFISFMSKNYLSTVIGLYVLGCWYEIYTKVSYVSLIFTWISQVSIKGQTPFDGQLTMEKTVIKLTPSCQHFD